MNFNLEKLDRFPTEPGVYLMKNQKGDVLYVGKAKNLKKRVKQYFASSGDDREMIPFLTALVRDIETIIVTSEREALLLENTLIKRHKPKFNAVLKDDATYISLMINHKHQWPRLSLVRYKGAPPEKGLYFGPYTNAFAARQTYDLMTKIFPLRQCSDEELKRRTRPCLLYSIKRCVAPCVNLCTKEQYDELVDGAIKFLKGQDKELLKALQKEMEEASDNLEFEKAAALLRTIRQIEHITSKDQVVVKTGAKDCDALGLFRQANDVLVAQLIFREGKLIGSEHFFFPQVAEEDDELLTSFILQHYKDQEKKPHEILLPLNLESKSALSEILDITLHTPQKGDKLTQVEIAMKNAASLFIQEKHDIEQKEKTLLDLQEVLHLSRYPKRIECFDTSNISGSDLVACMVAFVEGEKDKKRQRFFTIRNVTVGDDYGAMHETLLRRLTRAKAENDLPDLILIDGGKGQLNVALAVFKELDIATVDAISIAKEEARHDKGLRKEKIFLAHKSEPLLFDTRSPLLFFLQKIRDETHRVAIAFHRKKRSKRTLSSSIEKIPGIGDIKRQRLLSHFGSLHRIAMATDEEILAIKGVTKKDLISLRKFLKKES